MGHVMHMPSREAHSVHTAPSRSIFQWLLLPSHRLQTHSLTSLNPKTTLTSLSVQEQ